MYEKANVSGPVEFARLPAETQVFWNGWLEEHVRRTTEQHESVQNAMRNL